MEFLKEYENFLNFENNILNSMDIDNCKIIDDLKKYKFFIKNENNEIVGEMKFIINLIDLKKAKICIEVEYEENGEYYKDYNCDDIALVFGLMAKFLKSKNFNIINFSKKSKKDKFVYEISLKRLKEMGYKG